MIAAMAEAPPQDPAPILLRAPPAAGEPTLEALLPVFQGLTNEVARRGAAKAVADGEKISCRAGCGACCRQAVPVAEAEARMLAALVAAMPEPRRSEIRA